MTAERRKSKIGNGEAQGQEMLQTRRVRWELTRQGEGWGIAKAGCWLSLLLTA